MEDELQVNQWFELKKKYGVLKKVVGTLVRFDRIHTVPESFLVHDVAGNPHCVATSICRKFHQN